MSVDSVMDRIAEAIGPELQEIEVLREGIAEVRAMLDYEDRNWAKLFGPGTGDQVEGLDLDQVQDTSIKARKKVAASALNKRAADLHAGYVFGNGFEIHETDHDPTSKGPKTLTHKFYNNPINQESIFSGAARRELQYARFSDGNVIALCNRKTREVRRVPISEISNVLLNPDHPEEIWAWLREWTSSTPDGKSKTRAEWVYTNRVPKDRRQKTISVGGKPVPVSQDSVVVDLRANRQVGWTFGVPDALAGMHWAEAYGEVLRYGQIVNESLAKVTHKVVTASKKGSQNAGVSLGTGGPGQAAVMGEGQDIQLVNSSQRSFDFTAARPLAAMAAAAWNVSNIDLLSDSSAAGSSYGAAQSLTPGMQNAMNAMRLEWTQFYQDIFEVVGLGRPEVHWPPMETPDPYRQAQELTLYSIALTDEEYRAEVLDRLDIAGNASEIPPSLSARGEIQRQAASPDQGKNSPSGSTDSGQKNDQRTDAIGEVLRQVRDEEFLERMEQLVQRAEAAARGDL